MAGQSGLEISERFFGAYGAPMLAEKFGPHQGRIAVGLVGMGSDCFGYDDELSRSHDWGPSFCIWLARADFERLGPALRAEFDKLPASFEGFTRKTSAWGGGRIGVFSIGGFYRNFIGLEHVPATTDEWLAVPQYCLAVCTNGKVFVDPLGEFTAFRERLKAYYPEDVRLKKIAGRCMAVAQYGQYNFMRCVKRKEYVAADHAEAKFCEDAISLAFLLNKRYAPFFKWMHRAAGELPLLGDLMHAELLKLVTTHDFEQKSRIIEGVCQALIAELKRQGLSDATGSFLADHGPSVQSRIKDASLRNRDVWAD